MSSVSDGTTTEVAGISVSVDRASHTVAEARLETLEGLELLFERQIAEEWRLGQHLAAMISRTGAALRAASRPSPTA